MIRRCKKIPKNSPDSGDHLTAGEERIAAGAGLTLCQVGGQPEEPQGDRHHRPPLSLQTLRHFPGRISSRWEEESDQIPTSLLVSHKNCSLRMEWLEVELIPFQSCRAQAGSSSRPRLRLLSRRLNLPPQGQRGVLRAIGRMSSCSFKGRTFPRMGLSRWSRLQPPTVPSQPHLPQ